MSDSARSAPASPASTAIERSVLPREPVEELAALGVVAFTTTRDAGSFSTSGDEPIGVVMARWSALLDSLAPGAPRFATARQVHGSRVVLHDGSWEGWLRVDAADGHAAIERGTGMAISIADCVPAFLAHPSGAVALLHSGWRGTEARIIERGIHSLAERGLAPSELHLHLGPAICGRCYEVSPDVYARLTGRAVPHPTPVDLRSLIADHARRAGIRQITISRRCTRCDNDRFFSHRAGDPGRQLAVLLAPR